MYLDSDRSTLMNIVEDGGDVKAESRFLHKAASYWKWKWQEKRLAGSLSQTRGERKCKQECNNLEYTELLLLVFNFSNQTICSSGTISRTKARCLQICIDLHMFCDIWAVLRKHIWSYTKKKMETQKYFGICSQVFLHVYSPSSPTAGEFHSSITAYWKRFPWWTSPQPYLLP